MPPLAASTSTAGSPHSAGESVRSPSPPPPARAPSRAPANANSSSLPPHSTSFRPSQPERRHRPDPAFLISHPVHPTPRGARTQPGRPPACSRETRSRRTTHGETAAAGGSTSPDGGAVHPTPRGARTQPVRRPVRSRETRSLRTTAGGCSLVRCTGIIIVIVIVIVIGNRCSSDADCVSGLSCYNCNGFTGKKWVRTTIANPFNTVGTSLPFNKYAFLTTHNSFSIAGVTRFTLYNQEDSVTDQLNNGVRALMLDVYDFRDDIWLCHSLGGKCFVLTAFEPAIYTMREIEVFLLTNPSEIVTLILEDHVMSHHGLSKLFNKTGLMKYWFPVSRMPQDGKDWPRVSDMIKLNHRLLVFTSNRSKESSEEIAYQWNHMVENQYGDGGMDSDVCYNRLESPVLSDRTKSLVLVNYFRTIPLQWTACMEHSRGLVDVLNTCYAAAGNRWANFLAVDYYKRSDGGGVFQATDMLNGMLICGRNDVRACRKRTLKGALYDLLHKLGLVWKASPMH